MFGFSSTFSLPTFTLPANWSAIRSMTGDNWRHGPHHGAQKSATSSVPLPVYSSQLLSVSSITFGLAMKCFLDVWGARLPAPTFYAPPDTAPASAFLREWSGVVRWGGGGVVCPADW